MKQKLLSVLLTLMVGVSGMYVKADPVASGSCGENLTWEIVPKDEMYNQLVITGTGAMNDYKSGMDVPWRNYLVLTRSVSLPEGLTEIGNYAFYDMYITTVTIPEGVVRIGAHSFYSSDLESVSLPSSVKTIEKDAFSITELASLTIPAGVSSIDGNIVYGCSKLTSLSVADGNSKYDSREGCNAIVETETNKLLAGCKSTVIIASIDTIGEYACTSLTSWKSIEIPNGVKKINDLAFSGCIAASTLSIPASVVSIGNKSFTECQFSSIAVDANNPVYDSRNDCNAIIETSTNTLIKGCKNTTIPEDIKILGNNSFASLLSFTTITIPEGVTRIGNDAFSRCSKLSEIEIPASVTEIGASAFESCTALASVTLNEGLKRLGANVFSSCTGLTTLTLPASLTKISSYAFKSCRNLSSLTSLATVPPESDGLAFSGVTSSIPVYVPEASIQAYKEAIDWSIFSNYQALPDGRIDPELSYEKEQFEIEVGKVDGPSLQNNYGVAPITWTSSDESIATVDEYGRITGIKVGETTITASFAGNEEYKASEASIKVKVIQGTYFVFCGINVNDANCADILGNGKASFVPKTNTLTLDNLAIDFKTASYETDEVLTYDPDDEILTIIIKGVCSFSNIEGGIISDGGLTIKGADASASLTISCTYTAIGTADQALVVDGCQLTAIGIHEGVPAIVAQGTTFTVTNNGRVLAKNTKEVDDPEGDWGFPAIAAMNPDFDKSIGILTKGVHFFLDLSQPLQWPGSFYTDEENKVYASEVEIGKCAVPVSDTEQTTISFGNDDGAESAVFSPSTKDYYNIEQDRLEISSTLTDEEVAQALESLTPGSSEWTAKLPGSIAFFIPKAGKGSIEIECQTFDGFVLKVKMEGNAAIEISQATMGKATVNYEVVAPTYVVIYLHGKSSSAPARMATNGDEENAGAYIKSITITPASGAEACSEDMQGTCGENLKWVITCDNELVITGTGAMDNFTSSNIPWKNYRSTITSVVLQEGITSIGDWAFYQCSKLTEITIPEGVTSMGYVALSGCQELPSVSLPSTLETIGGGMFSQDWALESLTIPAAVTRIGDRLTEGCGALAQIVVEDGNKTFDSRENCNAVIKTSTNTLVAGCMNTVIPNTVEIIGQQAFSSIKSLKAIVLPSSVTKIEDYAFQYCSGVPSLNIPTSVVSISGTAFFACQFEDISVAPGNPKFDSRDNCNAIIETESNKMIKGCINTVFPDEVTVIGEGAFYNCGNLKSIIIPAGITKFEENAFGYCSKLESFTCLAAVPPTLGYNALSIGTSIISTPEDIPVYVPAGSIEAYQSADTWKLFTNYKALTNMYIVKALATHGQVTGTGTYESGTKIELSAVPDEGFVFKQWSNGETSSSINLVVEKDTTVRALFAMEETQDEEVQTQSGSTSGSQVLSFKKVYHANTHIIYVYLHGKLFGIFRVNNDGQITNNGASDAPARLHARKVEQEDPEMIQVEISGLVEGEDYTFSIDSFDEEENIVSAVAGSFKVEDKGTATSTDELYNKAVSPRKQLQNGHLLIEMPDGKRFDATGVQL